MAMTVNFTESSAQAGALAPKPAARPEVTALRPDGGPPEVPESDLSFWDILDVVNPLQHIPIVGSVYRAITGDEIGAPARVAGGLLYGGVVGLVASVASLAVEEESGQDPGEHLLAMLGMGPEGSEGEAGTAVAALPQDAAGPAAADIAGAKAVPTPSSVAESVPAVAPGGDDKPLRAASRMFALPPRGGQESGKVFALPARAVAQAPSSTKTAPVAGGGEEETASASESPAVPVAGPDEKPDWPPGGPTPLPRELIADAMMNALQKYERTARFGGRGQGRAAAEVLPGAS